MSSPNGHSNPPILHQVPVLGKQDLTHYLIVVVEGDNLVEHDYLVSGYQVDGAGNLHLVMNQMVVASLGVGVWKTARRRDFQPVGERTV